VLADDSDQAPASPLIASCAATSAAATWWKWPKFSVNNGSADIVVRKNALFESSYEVRLISASTGTA